MAPLWAVIADVHAKARKPLRVRLPSHLVHIKRFKFATIWIWAFLELRAGTIVRVYSIEMDYSRVIEFTVDASPWGFGGILWDGRKTPVAYFWTAISNDDKNYLVGVTVFFF